MQGLLNKWRYYGLEPGQYHEGMKKLFNNNLQRLCLVNIIAAVLMGCYAILPILVDHDIFKACIYIAAAVIAVVLFFFSTYKLKQLKLGKQPGNQVIYLLMVLFYMTIMLFCIYIGVWSNPGGPAVTFMSFLICSLFLFINPPTFNLGLNFSALFIFSISSIIFKTPKLWISDIMNAFLAFILSSICGWQISMMRIRFALDAIKLEDERDNFYALSTIDELTQLKNRRDFFQTFKRFLFNYRQSDKFLCIAILDIDFFKSYNDFYGHPKGDECLRSVGRMFNDIQNSKGIYAARVGGEEFAMLWFENDFANIDSVTSLISQKMRGLNIPHKKSKAAPYVTISMGVYVSECGAFYDMNVLYDLADKALYAAKTNGRNCAVVSSTSIAE